MGEEKVADRMRDAGFAAQPGHRSGFSLEEHEGRGGADRIIAGEALLRPSNPNSPASGVPAFLPPARSCAFTPLHMRITGYHFNAPCERGKVVLRYE